MSTEQSIADAGRVWSKTVGDIPALKKRIRARAEARIEELVAERRAEAAKAIHCALCHGATKTALREVTTKDHRGFEEYVELGEELARDEHSMSS